MGKVCVAPGCESGYKPKAMRGKRDGFICSPSPRMSPYANSGQKAVPRKK
ncbi:Hypothetical protein FKW44_020755 [Caligus rogercresseyi]|uniref:Uncharacterized protein n=1 Tax=Caligus rogercresseyi TaxID=217165 RepID=A0A7T8GQS3_CALRO|nr:Hypothetical protein FKW44_020755 [Caligus rogercresseyi]